MTNPLKTEHSLDWSKTAQEIEDEFQAGMIERDRYKKALEAWKWMMANDAYDIGELVSEFDKIVNNTLSA